MNPTGYKKVQGFSCLEALMALMLLNLLCLGLLNWQLQALKAQRDALAFQNALELSQDLWHRMQLNHRALSAYQLSPGVLPTKTDCQSKACTAQEWAQADLTAWYEALQVHIPGGKALLETQTSSSPLVKLRLIWPGPGGNESTDCSAQYRCWETTWQP